MAKVDLNKVEEIFHLAILEPSSLRTEFVNAFASADDETKKEVLALIAAHDKVGSFLEDPIDDVLISKASKSKPSLSVDIDSGTRIGDYIIRSKIGSGSFGEVYLAEDQILSRTVAAKVTPKRGNEGKTLAQLQHPHIVSIYSQVSSDQWHYVFMQFIDGQTLDQKLADFKDIKDPSNFVFDLALQLTSAMSFAHKKGILHLDIKPQNIMLNKSGDAFLGDFNISLDLKESNVLIGGTPRYMAPEQQSILAGEVGHGPINATTDIYSFGIVIQEIVDQLVDKGFGNQINNNFSAIASKCSKKEQNLRFQNAEDIHHALLARRRFNQEYSKLPSPGPLLTWANVHPFIALMAFVTLPNILGSLFNIGYNDLHIVSKMSPAEHAIFRQFLAPFNLIVHSSLTLLILYWLRSPVKSMFGINSKDSHAHVRASALRSHVYIGRLVSCGWLIGLCFWPSLLYFSSGTLQPTVAVHFVISFIISWLISLSYSALLAKFVFFRNFYPQLLMANEFDIDIAIKQDHAKNLFQISPLLKYLAGATPMLALLTLFWTTDFSGGAGGLLTFKLLASGLAVGGILGLLFSVQLSILTENATNLFRKFAKN